MPEESTPFSDPGSLARGRFTYFPVAPNRLEFAIEARAAILRERPQVVALELPVALQEAWMRAVARLPEMSVIFYPDETTDDTEAVYVPVEPADPFTEAIRTGLEIGAEIVFADQEAGLRPHLKDAYPDPYAIRRIGLERYVEAYRVYPQQRSEEIARHAAGIAWKLQGTDPDARVLVVISLNLLDPLLDAMEEPQAQPLARTYREGVEVFAKADGGVGAGAHANARQGFIEDVVGGDGLTAIRHQTFPFCDDHAVCGIASVGHGPKGPGVDEKKPRIHR